MQYGIYGKGERSLVFIRSAVDDKVTQSSIYNYHKEATATKSFCDTCALGFVMPLSCLLPTKSDNPAKNIFQGFVVACVMEVSSKMTHHSSHCQPFSVDEMFHASLSTDCKITVTLCPSVLWEGLWPCRQSSLRLWNKCATEAYHIKMLWTRACTYSVLDNAPWWTRLAKNLTQ